MDNYSVSAWRDIKNSNSYGGSISYSGQLNDRSILKGYTTSLNWSNGQGFSNSFNYSLSDQFVKDMNQGVAGAWDGFSNAMGNNWNNVLGGFGWLMGRKEDEEGSDISFCFPKGTLIKTKTGLRKIEDLIPGDLVLSYNHNLQKNEYKPIVRLFRKVTQTWIDIQFDIDKRLTATPGHQIYIKGEGYIDAIKIESGMKFIDSSFNEHLINDKLTREVNDEETYNFEVEGNHNYYVSKEEILVHNDSLKLAKIQALNYYQQKIERNEPLTQEEINNMDLLEADLGVGNYAEGINVKGKKTIGEKGIIKKQSLQWGKSTTDENGNVIQNGYSNLFDYSIGAIKLNGSIVTDGTIVKIDSNGKMQVVKADQIQNGTTVFVNGIMNDHSGGLGGLKLVSQEIGKEVYLVYNSTGGAVPDLSHSAAGRLGLNTEASQNVVKKIIESGKVDTILAHSEGSLIVGNALKDFVDKEDSKLISNINLATFGSPAGVASIPAGLKSAVFYENTKSDPVAWLGSLGRRLVLIGRPNYMI
jgi:hypothetical protein